MANSWGLESKWGLQRLNFFFHIMLFPVKGRSLCVCKVIWNIPRSKNGVSNPGAQSSVLATLIPLLMLLSLIVSMMIPVILADLLSRQSWLFLLPVLPFVGSIPIISQVWSSHILQKSSKGQKSWPLDQWQYMFTLFRSVVSQCFSWMQWFLWFHSKVMKTCFQ